MSRRILGLIILVVGLAVAAVGGYRYLRATGRLAGDGVRSLPKGNVVLVTIDTLRADHLGCYGGDGEVTPVLDSLASGGVLFEQAQAVAPITLPSHASMLTGLYPPTHGIRNNGMFALPEGIDTLASVLGREGYATGAFVSASVLARRYGLGAGFDVFDDDLSRGRHGSRHTVPERTGDVTVAAALEWLGSLPEDRPFFLWLHLYDPHAPYAPPPEFRERYPSDPYTGEIAFTDTLVGQCLGFLSEKELLGRTIVSVVADHGEALGEHGERTHAILLHQATIHVPWIVAGPNLPAGVRVAAPVSGADVAPTLAALVGARFPRRADLDGRSVLPLLGGRAEGLAGRHVYFETLLPHFQYGWVPLTGVRRGDWEVIAGRYSQLFAVGADPRELMDLADRAPSELISLEGELGRFEPESAEDEAAARLDLTHAEAEKLQALGYLGVEAAPREDPPDPRDLIGAHVHMEVARDRASRGLLDEAVAELALMLEADPGNVSALALQAQVLSQKGRPDESRAVLERCLSLDPDNANIYAQLAQLELRSGRPEQALELARLGAGKRGAFEVLFVQQSNALNALGRTDEARDLLDERLSLNPEDADLLVARAGMHGAASEVDEAEKLLRRAVEVDAMHVPSRQALAKLLEGRGRTDEAVELMEALLSIEPGHPVALSTIGRLRLSDPEAARPFLEEAVRLNPSRFEPLVSLGVCYLRLGLAEKAEAQLRRAMEIREDDPHAGNALGVSLTMQGRHQEAESLLRGVVAARPTSAETRNNLALVLARQGRMDEAEAEAREALRLQPGFPDAVKTLAGALHVQMRYAEEVKVLEPLVTDRPDDLEAAGRYGVALATAGECDRALPQLRRALDHFSAEGQLVVVCARCEEAAGDPVRARRLFEQVAQLTPPGDLRDEATAAIERLARGGR